MAVKNIVAMSLVTLLLAGMTVYGVYYNEKALQYEAALENQYDRAFSDLIGHMDNAEHYLLKSLATGTKEKTAAMLEEASRSAAQAESCLNLLPLDQHLVDQVSNYLVQLGDVALAWSNQSVRGRQLEEEQYNTLVELYGYAQDLSGSFRAMAADLGNTYDWRGIQRDNNKLEEDDSLREQYRSLHALREPFTDYPTLIYDGPFSEHMADIEPRGLSGEMISQEDGQKRAEEIFDNYTPTAEFVSQNDGNSIPTYTYRVIFQEDTAHVAFVDVTQQGGALYSVLFYRDIAKNNLSPEQAVKAGESFLQSIGMRDMKSTYYTVDGNCVTASYVYSKQDVMYYPDMVKVKIALDTGEMVGYEGHGYLTCHCEREKIEPSLTVEEAREVLSPYLEVVSEGEAVIPNDYGGEQAVYEFRCQAMGRDFLVYVDKEDGSEADVLVLLEDDTGTLTV